MALGPLMIDIAGTSLSDEDAVRLKHPLVGGVILFTRNFESVAQLTRLCAEIHALRSPTLLIAVDHEGGRVQRFREGFSRLPPMRELGNIWDQTPSRAVELARQTGFVLAAELCACGVDFSFAPVLDVDYGESGVIGDRAFHRNIQAISDLGHGLINGMKEAGMANVGKHYPGHGFVRADSHTEVPIDERELVDIELDDLVPFKRMIGFGMTAVMPAHVIYPKVAPEPAGFSEFWLKTVLRERLGFDGVIFSDDLSMEGASVAGGVVARAHAALDAGCDMVLLCNDPDAADDLLLGLRRDISPVSLARLIRMHASPKARSWTELREDADYVMAVHAVATIGVREGELPLG